MKLSPTLHASGAFMASAQTLPTYNYAVEKLSDFGPAYLYLLRAINDVTGTPIAELQTRTLQELRDTDGPANKASPGIARRRV